MKTILLLRHAKAMPDDGMLDDHARPLNDRGRAATREMASYMQEHKLLPNHVACSPSARTTETLDILLETLPAAETSMVPSLYLATAGEILDVIQRAPESAHTLLVVGHNPGIHVLAQALATQGDEDQINELHTNFPTCALAVIRFDHPTWDALASGEGLLTHFVTPKTL